jgi:hypothetical protein
MRHLFGPLRHLNFWEMAAFETNGGGGNGGGGDDDNNTTTTTTTDSYVDDTFGTGNIYTESTPGASTVNYGNTVDYSHPTDNDDDNDYSYVDTSNIAGISAASGVNYNPTANDDDNDSYNVGYGAGEVDPGLAASIPDTSDYVYSPSEGTVSYDPIVSGGTGTSTAGTGGYEGSTYDEVPEIYTPIDFDDEDYTPTSDELNAAIDAAGGINLTDSDYAADVDYTTTGSGADYTSTATGGYDGSTYDEVPTSIDPDPELDAVEKNLVSIHGWTDNGDGTVTNKNGGIYDGDAGGYLEGYSFAGPDPIIPGYLGPVSTADDDDPYVAPIPDPEPPAPPPVYYDALGNPYGSQAEAAAADAAAQREAYDEDEFTVMSQPVSSAVSDPTGSEISYADILSGAGVSDEEIDSMRENILTGDTDYGLEPLDFSFLDETNELLGELGVDPIDVSSLTKVGDTGINLEGANKTPSAITEMALGMGGGDPDAFDPRNLGGSEGYGPGPSSADDETTDFSAVSTGVGATDDDLATDFSAFDNTNTDSSVVGGYDEAGLNIGGGGESVEVTVDGALPGVQEFSTNVANAALGLPGYEKYAVDLDGDGSFTFLDFVYAAENGLTSFEGTGGGGGGATDDDLATDFSTVSTDDNVELEALIAERDALAESLVPNETLVEAGEDLAFQNYLDSLVDTDFSVGTDFSTVSVPTASEISPEDFRASEAALAGIDFETGLPLGGVVPDEDIQKGGALYENTLDSIKDRVAEVEGTSGPDGYNTLLGYSQDQFTDKPLTEMTVSEVLAMQKARGPGTYAEYSKDTVGRIATPAGKYQVVGQTLQGLVDQGIVDPNALYDAETQEDIGSYLIENRGFEDLVNGDITQDEFEANLGKEFEGIERFGYDTSVTSSVDGQSSTDLYLSAMEKVSDPNYDPNDPNSTVKLSDQEQRALYGARGQTPNAAETAYLNDLLSNARHAKDSEIIGADGEPIYKAGDYVTEQSFGDKLGDLAASAFDLFVNPLSVFGEDFTIVGQNKNYVQEQLDAYKNGGTFVYDDDGKTVVGIAEANYDADNDGQNDTVVLYDEDGKIQVTSDAVGVEDIKTSNENADGEEFDIDIVDSDRGYTNTEDGVVTTTSTVENDNDDNISICEEGFEFDPVEGICMPIDTIGDGTGKVKLKPRTPGDNTPAPTPTPTPTPKVGGLTIRQPQFNKGGVVTRNIDKFANGGVVTPNIDNFMSGMR